MPITLSRRQIGDADRVAGIELMLLWPDSLGPEPSEDYIRLDYEREANPAEKAAAEALVKPSCEAAGLVPIHVRVTRLRRPADLPVLGQNTSKGYRYFTGKMHPISPDSWTADIRKAMHFSGESAATIREHVNAYTWGEPIQRVRT